MRTVLVVLMALTTSPASAQVGFQFGPLVAARDDFTDARLGLYAGVHYDMTDRFQIGVLYVQRGKECCLVHSVEVPAVYRRKLDEVAYVLIGGTLIYGEDPDIGTLLGLGGEIHASDARTVGLEATFVYGLLSVILGAEEQYRDRTFRVGLNIR